jgi:hypothetical protein
MPAGGGEDMIAVVMVAMDMMNTSVRPVKRLAVETREHNNGRDSRSYQHKMW